MSTLSNLFGYSYKYFEIGTSLYRLETSTDILSQFNPQTKMWNVINSIPDTQLSDFEFAFSTTDNTWTRVNKTTGVAEAIGLSASGWATVSKQSKPINEAVSSDWTRVLNPSANPDTNVNTKSKLLANNVFVLNPSNNAAYRGSQKVYISDNGAIFGEKDFSNSFGSSGWYLQDIEWVGDKYICTASANTANSYIFESPNMFSWTQIGTTSSNSPVGASMASDGNGKCLIVTSGGIYYTTDNFAGVGVTTNWQSASPSDGTNNWWKLDTATVLGTTTTTIVKVKYLSDGYFYILGASGGNLWRLSSESDVQQVTVPGHGQIHDIAYNGKTYLATGYDSTSIIGVSGDGINWEQSQTSKNIWGTLTVVGNDFFTSYSAVSEYGSTILSSFGFDALLGGITSNTSNAKSAEIVGNINGKWVAVISSTNDSIKGIYIL